MRTYDILNAGPKNRFMVNGRIVSNSGRLIQVHNLPQNHLPDLDLARQLLTSGNHEAIELLFDSTPDTLSQLIRTALIPEEGCRFIVTDFSAIEARVIAWLAGEKWRLDVFNSHGKIYEASAAQMFKVPVKSITKGNSLRQKGKIAELALGYAGGAGALMTMGALKMGLTEEELPGLVKAWRQANQQIVRFWYDVESAAVKAVTEKTTIVLQYGLAFIYEPGVLFIRLPSGRRLAYVRPRMELDRRFDKLGLTYEGYEKGKWNRLRTYGGKLVENCLAGDTQVLTKRGCIQIKNVQPDDLIWDGTAWVSHKGLVCKGLQQTIEIDGTRITPEHLILTERGWFYASSCEGYYRNEVILPDGYQIHGLRRNKVALENPLHLWKRAYNACFRVLKKKTKILRLPEIQADFRKPENSWNVETSSLLGMEVNGGPLSAIYASILEELRRQGYRSLLKMARRLQELLDGYGVLIHSWFNHRAKKCERRLHSRELLLGHIQTTGPEQTKKRKYLNTLGPNNSGRSLGAFWNRCYNFALQISRRMARKPFIRKAGCYEPVYDLLNAGPRHRFMVLGNNGPFIVHNCVQATARDCLAEALLRLDGHGYKIVFHVHDEAVLEIPVGQGSLKVVNEIMGCPLDWAPGLPMKADGFITNYYKKD